MNKWIILDTVKIMRLNPPVTSEYNDGHYLCTLVEENGEATYLRADFGDDQVLKDYTRLIHDLHAYFKDAPKPPKFMTGLASPLGFWVFTSIFSLVILIMIAAVVAGVHRRKSYFLGVVLIGITLAVTYFVIKFMKAILFPAHYDPQNLSEKLLPSIH